MKDGSNRTSRYDRNLRSGEINKSAAAGGGSPIVVDECEKINYVAGLQRLQPALEKKNVGDILMVDVNAEGQVVAISEDGVCGIIIATFVAQLKACLQSGKKFKAAIKTKTDSTCDVIVRPLKP